MVWVLWYIQQFSQLFDILFEVFAAQVHGIKWILGIHHRRGWFLGIVHQFGIDRFQCVDSVEVLKSHGIAQYPCELFVSIRQLGTSKICFVFFICLFPCHRITYFIQVDTIFDFVMTNFLIFQPQQETGEVFIVCK